MKQVTYSNEQRFNRLSDFNWYAAKIHNNKANKENLMNENEYLIFTLAFFAHLQINGTAEKLLDDDVFGIANRD